MQICVTQLCVLRHCVMNNPFEFGPELGTGELVDRDDEVAVVVQTVRQGTNLFLIGPHRAPGSGKGFTRLHCG